MLIIAQIGFILGYVVWIGTLIPLLTHASYSLTYSLTYLLVYSLYDGIHVSLVSNWIILVCFQGHGY